MATEVHSVWPLCNPVFLLAAGLEGSSQAQRRNSFSAEGAEGKEKVGIFFITLFYYFYCIVLFFIVYLFIMFGKKKIGLSGAEPKSVLPVPSRHSSGGLSVSLPCSDVDSAEPKAKPREAPPPAPEAVWSLRHAAKTPDLALLLVFFFLHQLDHLPQNNTHVACFGKWMCRNLGFRFPDIRLPCVIPTPNLTGVKIISIYRKLLGYCFRFIRSFTAEF